MQLHRGVLELTASVVGSCSARYAAIYAGDVLKSQRVGAALVTTGAAIALVGTFLPWLRSGATRRSSYEIFELVDRLGFSPNGVVGWALRLWPLVPLLLIVSAVLQWWQRPERWVRVRTFLPTLSAFYVGGTSAAVIWAPDAALFRFGSGPIVTLVGCLAVLAGVTLTSGP